MARTGVRQPVSRANIAQAEFLRRQLAADGIMIEDERAARNAEEGVRRALRDETTEQKRRHEAAFRRYLSSGDTRGLADYYQSRDMGGATGAAGGYTVRPRSPMKFCRRFGTRRPSSAAIPARSRQATAGR